MGALSGKPSNNPQGRPAGSLNRINGSLRQRITTFLENHWQEVEEYWKKLEPKDKLLFIKDLLPYASPRLQASSVEMTLDVSKLTDKELDSVIKKIMENASNEPIN